MGFRSLIVKTNLMDSSYVIFDEDDISKLVKLFSLYILIH